MSAFALHVGYEFKAAVRDRSHLFMNYLFPLLFFALVSAFMTRMDGTFRNRVIPAMAVFALMCSCLLSMPPNLVGSRLNGMLRSYRIYGVPSWTAIAAPALSNLGHMAIVTLVIAATATLTLGAPMPADPALFCAAWLASAAALAGLGALVAVVSRTGRMAILVAQVVYIPSIMLGGLMMPQSALPPALGQVALLLPASHAMRAFAGGPGAAISLAALAAGGILSFVLSLLLFEWDATNTRPGARKLLALAALIPYAATLLA